MGTGSGENGVQDRCNLVTWLFASYLGSTQLSCSTAQECQLLRYRAMGCMNNWLRDHRSRYAFGNGKVRRWASELTDLRET
jgi:hypothetical protein